MVAPTGARRRELAEPIPRSMRACFLESKLAITVRETATPRPRPHDVLVRIDAVGVCGSDVHFYRDGRVGDLVVDAPLILGHEASGHIVAVGSKTSRERIGERVAIEPQRPCRGCRYCLTGRYNLCESMEFFSAPPIDGALAEYLCVPADFAYRVPDSVSDAAAALLEPLSVAIAAVRKARVTPGSAVLVSGAGPIGVLTAAAARAFGATRVVVSDPIPERLVVASRFGATDVSDPTVDESIDDSVDAYIDASGSRSAIHSGIRALHRGGTAVLVGMGAPTVELDLFLLQSREISLHGLFRYVDTWETALAIAQSGTIRLDDLVSGTLGLDDVDYALQHNSDPNVMKFIITPGQRTEERSPVNA